LPTAIRHCGSLRETKKSTLSNPSLHDENHLRVLRLLEANPRMNQRDLAEAMGVSLGKTNYCLKALLGKGLIKMQNFRNSQNKLAYTYLLTPSGIVEKSNLTARFLKRKIMEYESLKQEIESLKREVDVSGPANPDL
jgi:EPS-associated MarR family transcriptional regulator